MTTSAFRCTRQVTLAAPWWPKSLERHTAAATGSATAHAQAKTMNIRIDLEGTRLTATLDDSAASRAFIALLQLTLTLEDYNGTEKISDLPKRLSTKDAPAGVDASRGDIAYYAPWGNLAIFYKDFPYSRGLVKLGRIDSGVEMFETSRALQVTLQRVDE